MSMEGEEKKCWGNRKEVRRREEGRRECEKVKSCRKKELINHFCT